MKTTSPLLTWPALLVLAACASGPRGRVMSDSDQDYVGNRAAGAETFDRLIEGVVQKTLQGRSAALGHGTGRLKVACCLCGAEGIIRSIEIPADYLAKLPGGPAAAAPDL